ncbi:PREDICTED: cytochrome b-c1 complex subunit 9 [Nicrophorus vespilloides]|uniref:Complex III subunit 9 n=1 Tax=Nicrophorus vespilloides TaxID=110193 RepID=A0ABM1NEA8_NICVS|nr:PREDICTED: cytochrome b-c1 complex subunit 9 [Nicrophorus vespilloides]
MALNSTLYNAIFKRTSTFVLLAMASTFFFERTFDLSAESIFRSVNQGKLYEDIKKEE